MKQKRKHLLKKLLIFGIAILLASCSEDLYEESQNDSKNTYSIKRVPLNELAIDQKFNMAFKKVSQKSLSNEIAVFSRTQIENEYGFTIVDEPSNVMEYNSKTSYSLEIQMDSTQADELKNLVIEVNSLNESKHFIVTYKLDENEAYRLSESEPIVIEEIAFDPNLAVSSRLRNDCIEVTTIYCAAAGTSQYCGGADTQYGCYRRTTTLCTGSGSYNSSGFVDLSVMASPVDSNHQTGGLGGGDLLYTPCAKVKKPFTKIPALKQRTQTLAGQTSLPTENGFYMCNNATSTTTNPFTNLTNGTNNAVELPISVSTPMSVIAHTHNSPSNTTYSVPSWEDLDDFSKYMQENPTFVDSENLVFIVITADGTRYALTINNIELFKDFFYWPKYDIANYDYSKLLRKNNAMTEYYYGNPNANPPVLPKIKENSTSNSQDLKHFLNMLQVGAAGVDVFEVNSTYTTFTQVTYNPNTDQIARTNCN